MADILTDTTTITENSNLLLQSMRDFFTPKMLKYALMPFIITMVALYIIFFVIAGMGLEQLGTLSIQSSQTTMHNGIANSETTSALLQGSSIIQFLMTHAITSWIVSFLVYSIGGFLVLYVSIFVAVLVIGFLTEPVLRELQQRHYPDVAMMGDSNIVEGIFNMIKWALIMLLLFLVLIPLYFIPLVNIVALNFPLYYFFHKAMTYDIASSICTNEEHKKIKYFNGNAIRMKTLAIYLVSLIPFTIFFGAIFYVIYLGHTYFLEARKVRS
ncbi:MAG: EI24 domain-containing protein [Sulfurimonas sp.]|jgi:hypothetical protein